MSGHALEKRRAGVILHPTSLPESPGNGDLGPQAYHFVDFLVSAGASVWQMLPIGQPHDDGSPYQCLSIHAGNRWLISIDLLRRWGWLKSEQAPPQGDDHRAYRDAMLHQGWHDFQRQASEADHKLFEGFVEQEQQWLRDYALFSALKKEYRGLSWDNWPHAQSKRHTSALRHVRRRLHNKIRQVYFEQFVFFKQWLDLKQYANDKGVQLFGDMPIFVAYDSADVWVNRKYFKLDSQGRMQVVAGVPPDYFSKTGQRWGNPCYDWEALREDNFKWWQQRILRHMELFDLIRIDHFRGFESYWEIPEQAETAINGRWVPAEGRGMFQSLLQVQPDLPLVAEDLGLITPKVIALRDEFDFPGMKIFQFGFDGDPKNIHLAHNHIPNCVAYSGTHDNDTSLSWVRGLDQGISEQVMDYLGHSSEAMPWPVMRAVLASVAKLAVVPMQDLLGLGSEHRMNMPGTTEGNWRWRFSWSQVGDEMASRFRHLVRMYNRLPTEFESSK